MNRKYLFVILAIMVVSLVVSACNTTEARYSAPKGVQFSEILPPNTCSVSCSDGSSCSIGCIEGQGSPNCDCRGGQSGLASCSC